MNILLNYLFR